MLKDLFVAARSNLDHFFETVAAEEVQNVVNLCRACRGLVILTGVGKSGIVAEKVATTLVSTGTRALYLSAMNSLHGDIGIVTEKDVIVLISKTGHSQELLQMIPFLKQRKAKTVAVVCGFGSKLADVCDSVVHLPVQKELCDFNLVPTTSTTVQLIFGDILAVALMKQREFNMQDYALNHPAGSIGKKLSVKVEDLMLKGTSIPLCRPKDRLMDVLFELTSKQCGALLVASDSGDLMGIFTDGDLRRALQRHGASILEEKMEALMNSQALVLRPATMALEAIALMQQDPNKRVAVAPIVEESKIVGVLRLNDIVSAGINS